MAVKNRFARTALFGAVAGSVLFGIATLAPAAGRPVRVPAPQADLPASGTVQTAVLAGGCFWGTQGMFEHVRGVKRVVAGYAGGQADTAHYEMVGSGQTGHAESIRVEYDPRQVSYGQILQLFFSTAHDPTEVDAQGPDEGSQYRSAIFVASPEQKQVAERYIAQLDSAGVFHQPIATRIEPMRGFYPAEGYHQDYLIHHPDSLYIVRNDLPKISALHRLYPDLYRDQPVTTGLGESKS